MRLIPQQPEDNDIQIATTSSGDLCKRQFTMHIVMNAGTGELCDGYIELIGKSTVIGGSPFSLTERSQWNPDVRMYFQKNAWMD